MREAGRKLREAREKLNLTYRDVAQASAQIAQKHGNPAFSLALSRLADIENKGVVPSIYRLYSLCAIYRLDLAEVLSWYGIPREDLAQDAASVPLSSTNLIRFGISGAETVTLPLDSVEGAELRRTTYLSRLIRTWGAFPLAMFKDLDPKKYRYGFIGTDDWFMYPLLPPGSLVLIDESRKRIASGGWTGESDRPIYFFETRGGFLCGWASLTGGQLVVQPHPASHSSAKIYAYPSEIDVVGRVAGVAIRLDLSTRRRAHF